MDIKKNSFLTLGVLVAIYLLVTFAIPPDPVTLARYNITDTYLRFIQMTIAAPLILIWFAAFYGFSRFKDYSIRIKDSADGKALKEISSGLTILAIGLPVTSILSAALNYYARTNQDAVPTIVIFNVYFALAIAISAYTLMRKGSKKLKDVANKPVDPAVKLFVKLMALAIWGVYFYLSLKNPYRTVPVPPATRATFYLPDWAIVTTVLIPYLYVWYSGLMSTLDINVYKLNAQGEIYKKALGLLAIGITTIILASILTQFLGALSPVIQALNLKALLVVVYVLLLIIATGYVFVAVGSKRLTKIEEA